MDAPADRLPFQLALVTVTVSPDWLQLPSQPWVSCWFPEYVYCRVQLETAELLLVIVIDTEKPAFH